MIINLEKLPDCKALLRIEIPSDDTRVERKQIIKLFSKQAKIPGFRPGKTPANVIEKIMFHFPREEAYRKHSLTNGQDEHAQAQHWLRHHLLPQGCLDSSPTTGDR